ncbi:MAG: M24 family metallopeptidase [Armatimonadota bacterium]
MLKASRQKRLWDSISDYNLDAVIITDLLNVRYISGYTGSFAKLFVNDKDYYILTDARYTEQVKIECPEYEHILLESEWVPYAIDMMRKTGAVRVGFEGFAVNYNEWNMIHSALPEVDLIPIGNPVGDLRQIKDNYEIAIIRKAAQIVDAAYLSILDIIQPGITEAQLTSEIDCALRRAGANKEGFDTIVVSGPRSALIHGKCTDRIIDRGDLVLMDFGANYQGYNSDITRTVVCGEPDVKQVDIFNIVLDAQSKAIDAIRPGVTGKDIDTVAREYITDKGFGSYFCHGLGHGLGLEVHDGRAFSKLSDIILEEGFVATVEPGIYLPGWGGIRIEDDILVTDSGCEILTFAPKIFGLH